MVQQLSIFTELAKAKAVRAKVTPRDYQKEAIERAFDLWERESGVLVRLPTGTGKTLVGSLIADRWLSLGKNYHVLVLAHERQLIHQFAEEIHDFLGIYPAIEMASQRCTGKESIIVATRQTLRGRRLNKLDPRLNWLIIFDEAHRYARKLKSVRPIVEHFEINPKSRKAGLTATPERTDKTSLTGLFPAVASDYRLYDIMGGPCAVNDGWAVPYDQRFVTVEGVDFKNIREVAKDFDKKELERILSERETLARLVDPMLDLVGDRLTLIFNPGVDMAKAVSHYINTKLGWEACVELDGSFPDDERKTIYKRFKRGDFQFMSVCGLCREGYNNPQVQAVATFRPTKSRPLAEQMKGRGCRPLPGVVNSDMTAEERRAAIAASDKPNCMIVDLVGVTGLADCASTAHIMAESVPDVVIADANRRAMEEDGPCDMQEIIRETLAEYEERKKKREAAEKKRAEQRQKRAEAAQKAKEERDRRRQALQQWHERQAAIDVAVRYKATQVESGRGVSVPQQPSAPVFNGASEKQIGLIKSLGIDLKGRPVSKGQAGRIITQLKSGVPVAEVVKTNRLTGLSKPAPTPPPTSLESINRLFMEAGR